MATRLNRYIVVATDDDAMPYELYGHRAHYGLRRKEDNRHVLYVVSLNGTRSRSVDSMGLFTDLNGKLESLV